MTDDRYPILPPFHCARCKVPPRVIWRQGFDRVRETERVVLRCHGESYRLTLAATDFVGGNKITIADPAGPNPREPSASLYHGGTHER